MKTVWIILSLFLLSACSTSQTNEAVQTAGNNFVEKTAASQKKAEEAKTVVVPEAKKPVKESKIGETVKLKDWEIKVDGFEFTKEFEINHQSAIANEGEKLLKVNMSLTNNGTKSAPFNNGSGIKVVYNEKFEYKSSTSRVEGDFSFKFVKPLSTEKGFYLIQLPDKVADATESLVAVFEIEKEMVSVKLR